MGWLDETVGDFGKNIGNAGSSFFNRFTGKKSATTEQLQNLEKPNLAAIPGYSKNADVAKLETQLGQMGAPRNLAMESGVAAGNKTQSLPEFEMLRRNLRQEANQAGQQQSEALQRRFAALGQANSGASIKAEQLGRQEIEKNLENQLGNIGFQEAQALRAQQNREEDIQNQKEQMLTQRNFQREVYNADNEWKSKVFQFDAATKLGQLDMAWNQNEIARITGDNQRLIDQYNLELSKIVAGKQKPGLLGSILGEGGLFG